MIRKVFLLLSLGLSLVLFNQTMLGQQPAPMPGGDWRLSVKPAALPNSPLAVTLVTTDARRGLALSKITLAFSEAAKRKPIKNFRVGWVVIDETNSPKIIGAGESGTISLNPSVGRSIQLNSTIFSFTSFAESIGATNLTGRFRVDIVVSFAEFLDGQIWKFDLPKIGSLNTQASKSQVARYITASKKTVKIDEACPNQECSWIQQQSSYRCETRAGFYCTNAATGQSCTEGRCGSGGGDLDLLM
jgi:hypothetical protein